MTTSSKNCPQCGTPLPTNAPAGLCPRCVMAMNMATETQFTGEVGPHGTRVLKTAPTPEELAAKFPQLEILELLGRGGMGAVYKARQKELDRIVALKILPPGIGDDPAFAERFSREAKALAKLNHPNIVTLYEFGRADGLFFFLMEFVDGVNLRQLLDTGRVAAREALAIVPQICDALQFAHDHGIVHRDIKPENILMDRRGRVKVADFGLAKLVGVDGRAGSPLPADGATTEDGAHGVTRPTSELTEAGKVMGTPQYMAPEQKEKPLEVDHRADIYALGVVFYQMLTGELPGKRIEAPSKKVQIDVRLDEIVLRALEKEPERRYQQASVMKTQVETIVENPGVKKSTAESRVARIVEIFAAIGFLGSLGFLLYALLPATRPFLGFPALFGFFWLIGFAIAFGWAARRRTGKRPPGSSRRDGNADEPPSGNSRDERRRRALLWYGLGISLVGLPIGIALKLPLVWALSLTGIVIGGFKLRRSGQPQETGAPAKSRIRRVLQSMVVALAIVFVLRTFVIAPFYAVNDAVSPEVPRGSWVLVLKLGRSFEAGDVVVYKSGQKSMLGRIAGEIYDGDLPTRPGDPVPRRIYDRVLIERRGDDPKEILASDVVGKVIFNTRPRKVDSPQDGFAGVIQRVVTDGIDFDTGKLMDLPLPHPLGDRDAARYDWFNGEESFAWMRQRGIDAVNGNHALMSANLTLVKLDEKAWDTLSANELHQKILRQAPATFEDQKNKIFGFKTREGGIGLLQIMEERFAPGTLNKLPGVKIRYKLVQQIANKQERIDMPLVELTLLHITDQPPHILPGHAKAWKADGTLLKQEADWMFAPGKVSLSSSVPSGKQLIGIAVRVLDSESTEPPRIADMDFDGEQDAIGSFAIIPKQKNDDDWIGLIRAFSPEQKAATIRVAVSHGPFISGPEPGKRWSSKGETAFGSFTTGDVFDRKGTAAVHLSHDLRDCDFRLLAFPLQSKRSAAGRLWEKLKGEVTSAGRQRQNWVVGRRLENKKNGSQNLELWEFPGLSGLDGAVIQFEVRPIHWVRLENIALQPGKRAEQESEFVITHRAQLGQAVLDTSRDFATEHQWKINREGGGTKNGALTVTIEATDLKGKRVTFQLAEQTNRTGQFKVSVEAGAEFSAHRIGTAIARRLGLAAGWAADEKVSVNPVYQEAWEFLKTDDPHLIALHDALMSNNVTNALRAQEKLVVANAEYAKRFGTNAELPRLFVRKIEEMGPVLRSGNVEKARELRNEAERAFTPEYLARFARLAGHEDLAAAYESENGLMPAQPASLQKPRSLEQMSVAEIVAAIEISVTRMEKAIAANLLIDMGNRLDQINEYCDQLQGKNKNNAPTAKDWNVSVEKHTQLLKLLAGMENDAEGMRSISSHTKMSESERVAMMKKVWEENFRKKYAQFKTLLKSAPDKQ